MLEYQTLFNYHTHTYRCGHAVGSDREYVESAIKNGYKTFGFADHSPYLFSNANYRSFRMTPNQLEDYCNSILSLKKEYEKQINIKLGLELEYYPDIFDKTLDFINQFPIEYFILAQHYVPTEPSGVYSGFISSVQELKEYVDCTITALNAGKFLYLAHPDLPGYNFDSDTLEREYLRLLNECKRLDIPVEFNYLGYSHNRHYPKRKLFELCEKAKCSVIVGLDTHDPREIVNPQNQVNNALNGLNLTFITKPIL